MLQYPLSQGRFRFSVGLGSLLLDYGPDALNLTTSRGEKLSGTQAEQALVAQLGFVPPFDALRFWVMGLPAPGETPVELSRDEAGRVIDMTQQQWRIRYERWTDVATRAGMANLPKRLVITRDDLRLTLFVQKWLLEAGN